MEHKDRHSQRISETAKDGRLILHCMKKTTWDKVRTRAVFGEDQIASDGFIHCSSVEYFWRVAPNFKEIRDELILLLIDTDRLRAKVEWEDADGCGRSYPHVYGLVPLDAVVMTLPYEKDAEGNWLKNEKLKSIPDR